MSNLTFFSGFKNSQYVWNAKKNIYLNQINFFRNVDIRGNLNLGSIINTSTINQNPNDNYLYYNASTGQLTYSTGGITDYALIEDNMSILNALIFNNGLLTSFSNSPFTIQIDTQFVDFSSSTSTSDTQFKLPLIETGTYNFIIDWGDGNKELITSYNQPSIVHTYPVSGVYTINIIGTCIGWSFGSIGDYLKLTDIKNWGTGFNLGTIGGCFWGCANMIISASDIPDLTGTTSLFACFANCVIMNSSTLSNWNISNVTNLNSMFLGCINFNQDLSSWDVSNVTNMLGLFAKSGFNNGDPIGDSTKPLNSWNTSNVISMSQTFRNCPFNQDISSWDTSNVIDMYAMFFLNSLFNQDISEWNVSNVKNMNSMFRASQFNQQINLWDVSNVTDMSNMFFQNSVFNQDISSWNVGNVKDMSSMFNSTSFNQDIGNWNTSNVENMRSMFNSSSFNQNIGNWDTSNVKDMNRLFYSATSFNNGNLTNTATNPLKWNTSNVTTFREIFSGANKFNQNISYDPINNYWNTLNVTDMFSMFNNCFVFNNGQITTINNVTPSTSTYTNADRKLNCPGATFLLDLTKEETIIVVATNLTYTTTVQIILDNENIIVTSAFGTSLSTGTILNIQKNVSGNKPLNWDTLKVTSTRNMFSTCRFFNQNISNFNMSQNENISTMFQNTLSFNNGDLITGTNNPLNWNTIKLTDMSSAFSGARIFNQNIGNWDVSKVTTFSNSFLSALSFNNGGSNDINNWSAPLCTTFLNMFNTASSFNQPLSNLVNTSNVNNCSLSGMFSRARLFNQNLNSWDVSKVSNFSNMFLGSLAVNLTTLFNNGETGLQPIPNINPVNAIYTNSTRTLTCTGATFTTTLTQGNVIIIQTPTIVYSSAIQSITNDTTLILVTAYGSNISSGITSIQKQIPGTSPLNWDVSNTTTLANMFQYSIFFNQNISNWNTQKVTTIANLFQGVTSGITLFNNGEIITGITAPMGVPTGWTFNSPPVTTNYRSNCRLTTVNKPASLP